MQNKNAGDRYPAIAVVVGHRPAASRQTFPKHRDWRAAPPGAQRAQKRIRMPLLPDLDDRAAIGPRAVNQSEHGRTRSALSRGTMTGASRGLVRVSGLPNKTMRLPNKSTNLPPELTFELSVDRLG